MRPDDDPFNWIERKFGAATRAIVEGLVGPIMLVVGFGLIYLVMCIVIYMGSSVGVWLDWLVGHVTGQ